MTRLRRMIRQWFSEGAVDRQIDPETARKRFQIAACVVLLEIAKSDEEFSPDEKKLIGRHLVEQLGVDAGDVEQLFREAETDRKERIDMWEHTHMINQYASHEDKLRLIEMAWGVVFSDHRLDKHEDYLMHKLAGLLRIPHDELIAAKLKMKPEGYRGR